MKWKNRVFAAFAAILMLCTLLAGCGGDTNDPAPAAPPAAAPAPSDGNSPAPDSDNVPAPAGDKTLKLYLAGFQNLDPQIWSWGTHADRMGIFEGLTILNPDFTTRLANAEKLEHDAGYTVWTATLRKDLQWSDGTPLTAEDYYYSHQRIIDPQYLQGKTSAFNTNAPILNALECQKAETGFDQVGIKVLDDYTIEYTLDTPCADFDVRLAESWALPVPRHTIEQYGDDWTKPENIVVNGPYIPTAREEDVHLTLGPNPNYYETPALEEIHLYTGTQNQLLAYQNGDINVATLTAADIDGVMADPALSGQVQVFDTSVLSFIGLLKGQNDVLQRNPLLRQAISLSIDRETIAQAVNKNTVTAAKSLVYPGFASWANDLDIVEYNVEKAQQLMSDAGYPGGEGLGTMTLLMSGTPGADTLAIADMISKGTGIQIQIVNLEWAAYVVDRDAFHEDDTWGIYLDAWNTSVANVGGGFSNYQFDMRVGNLETDALRDFAAASRAVAGEEAARQTCKNEKANEYAEKYEKLLKESDPTAINQGYRELETMRLEDASWIPLWWGKTTLLIQPSIQGYVGNPLLLNSPPFYFKDVSNG